MLFVPRARRVCGSSSSLFCKDKGVAGVVLFFWCFLGEPFLRLGYPLGLDVVILGLLREKSAWRWGPSVHGHGIS